MKSFWSIIQNNINFPNLLTLFRFVALPFVVYFILQDNIYLKILSLVIFILASVTDFVDGYLARKWNQETEFGKFLDPLADKILVLGCFITFIFLHEQIEIWMVMLIVIRDIMITILRYIAIRNGSSLRTSMMGKIKTGFQMGAIITMLLFFIVVSLNKRNEINEIYIQGRLLDKSGFMIAVEETVKFYSLITSGAPTFAGVVFSLASFLPYFGMLLATIITVWSGIRYFVTNSHLLTWRALMKFFKG